MKTKRRDIQQLIDYLAKHLVYKPVVSDRSFLKVGLRSFVWQDVVDTLIIKVTDDNLIIITDGENVVDGMEMRRLHLPQTKEPKDFRERIYTTYLQDILACF